MRKMPNDTEKALSLASGNDHALDFFFAIRLLVLSSL
jgi:hypothetical protein